MVVDFMKTTSPDHGIERPPPSPFKDSKVKNAHNILLLRLMGVPVLLIVLQVAAETNSFAFTRPSTGS